MGVLYIDRGFVSINGVEALDVTDISLDIDDGTKVVDTMTRNRRAKGFTKGNRHVNVKFSIAVQAKLGTPKLENIDYDSQDVALTFEHGGDRYTVTDLNHGTTNQSAPSVGTEGKKSFSLMGLDIIDQVGNSSLFSSALGLLS